MTDQPDPIDEADRNQGKRAVPDTGEVKGSGAGAGGRGNPEDFDDDAAGGGGKMPDVANEPASDQKDG